TIVGNSDIIERSSASGTPPFRLFDVAGSASLTLQNMTLQGGLAFGYGTAAQGGAVHNQGWLTLDGVTVRSNAAQGGAGYQIVYNIAAPGGTAAGGGVWSSGILTVESCTIQNNSAMGGRGFDGLHSVYGDGYPGSAGGMALGGGLYIDGGTVTITSST